VADCGAGEGEAERTADGAAGAGGAHGDAAKLAPEGEGWAAFAEVDVCAFAELDAGSADA